jgi:hypothetical protein
MDEDCRVILSTTLKLCVMLPDASYQKCIDGAIRTWNACMLRKIERCFEN